MSCVRAVLVALISCLIALSQGGQPITRDGFLKAAKLGGIEPDEFISILRTQGVDFQLSEEEKKQLAAGGISAKVLDAVSSNYRSHSATPDSSAGPTVPPGKAVAVVVHKDNPLNNIELSALARIYVGEQATWKSGKNIYVINRDPASTARRIFYRKVLKSDPGRSFTISGMSMMFRPIVQETAAGVKKHVGRVVEAIGYIDLSEVDSSVKVLSVNGIAPTAATLASGKYPLLSEE